jgi:CheY-like chemotaxis protein
MRGMPFMTHFFQSHFSFRQLCILACSFFFLSSLGSFGSEKEMCNDDEVGPSKKALNTKELDEEMPVSKEVPSTRVRGFSFPGDSQLRKSPNRKTSLPTPSVRKVILIIEDDLVIQRVFQSLFLRIRQDSSEYELMFTDTGEYGLFLYAVHTPVLTFIDGELLGLISGDEVVTEIYKLEKIIANMRKGKPGVDLDPLLITPINPSVLVAFSNKEELNDRMMELGAHYKITKPLKYNVLQDTLTKVLPPIESPTE